jgi:hypothetical protein
VFAFVSLNYCARRFDNTIAKSSLELVPRQNLIRNEAAMRFVLRAWKADGQCAGKTPESRLKATCGGGRYIKDGEERLSITFSPLAFGFSDLGLGSCSPIVAMMQTAESCMSNDAAGWRVPNPASRRSLPESKMRAILVVVGNVLGEQSF